jgi:tRNA nucleotidyltransferase (CCA-adding enzyme)
MIIRCPDYINKALKLLENSGFSAYAVGGCVRDSIMGRNPNDWDMTTSSTPEETMKVFKDYRVIPTGIKHGTVTVIIDSNPIEITTMRIDGDYRDNRHPDCVSFTSDIVKDLARRDFTVNAMAYNHSVGLVDPFNGTQDIQEEIIRCVGNPGKRFNEDALRILRALRFASVLNFRIDCKTEESISENLHLIRNVANERIRVELLKLLQGVGVEKILTDYKEVFFSIIPELRDTDNLKQNNRYHVYDVWTHTIKVVAGVRNTPVLRMAALLHDIGKPSCLKTDDSGRTHFKGHAQKGAEIAESILRKLKFSNKEIEEITMLIQLHDDYPDGDKHKVIKYCSEYSFETLRAALDLMRGDASGKSPEIYSELILSYETAERQIDEIEASGLCLRIADLEINGEDLRILGFVGKEIGTALKALLKMVIDEKIINKKDVLLENAKYFKKL